MRRPTSGGASNVLRPGMIGWSSIPWPPRAVGVARPSAVPVFLPALITSWLGPGESTGREAPVFVNKFGTRLTTRSVGRMLEKYLRENPDIKHKMAAAKKQVG